MTKEALKLALEALEDLGMKHYESTGEVLYKETFTAIKQAIANEALEKKAENARELGLNYELDWTPERIAGMARLKEAQNKKLVQPEQEYHAVNAVHKGQQCYVKTQTEQDSGIVTAGGFDPRTQRTWVGLTDIDYAGLPLEQVGLVRWAEAKLKEKNT